MSTSYVNIHANDRKVKQYIEYVNKPHLAPHYRVKLSGPDFEVTVFLDDIAQLDVNLTPTKE